MAPSRSLFINALATALLVLTAPARAADLDTALDNEPLEVHGFASQGYMKTTDNNYLTKSKDAGSFELTEVGLNFTKALTERLRMGVQFYAGGFVPTDRFNAKADWFYLDYHWRDWFGIRAGRVKLPFGLYNEINDISAARVSILLPQSVYPVSNRNFLLAQTGAEIYGYLHLGAAGALEYRLYGGTIPLDVTPNPASPYTLQSLTTPFVIGARLMWETPLPGLRLGGSVQDLRLDADLLFPKSVLVTVRIPALLWVASVEYAAYDLVLSAEFSEWHTESESSDPHSFPTSKATSERYYGMAAYRPRWWLQLGAYYSRLRPHTSWYGDRGDDQHDVAATVRFDINSYWLLKLEGHWMHGTAALSTALNGVRSLNDLAEDWAVFLVQTTVYF